MVGNAGSTGGVRVSVEGAGFGLFDASASVRVGGSGVNSSEWVSSSSVRSLVGAGVGAALG